MKTLKLIALIVLISFLTAGCGSGDDRMDLALAETSAADNGDSTDPSDAGEGEEEPPDVEGEPPRAARAMPKPVVEATPHTDEDVETDLSDLNEALSSFMDDNDGRLPKEKQLVSGGYIGKIPSAPKGSVYYFDKKQKKFIKKTR